MTRRSLVCAGTGRGVFKWRTGIGPELSWPVKAMMTPGSRWQCAECGRRVATRIAGQRGHWTYRFVEHPRRGVTKRDWEQT